MDGTIRYPIPAQADNTVHTVSLKLPDGNVNCEHCVIRWRYLAGNPSCQDGENGSGCGQQSELRNCADVTIEPLESRGYILEPPSRSFIGHVSDYDSLDCGGQWAQYNDLNEGKCGECGDEWRIERPRPNEEGGVNKLGATIEQKYTAGDVVNMTVLVTEDYGGYFEFRLCADKAEAEQLITQECLDRHLLKLADGSIRYQVPDKIANNYHNVTLQLPKGDVDCKNCVIQWLYRTGHKAWGTCEDGTFAMGCGDEQQEIRNCADIKIVQPPLTETAKGLLFMQTQYLGN